MWAERIRRFEGVRSVPGRPRGTHTPTMLLFDVSVRRETRIHLFLSLSFMSTRKGLLYMCALMSTPGGSPCPTLVLFNHAALPGCRQACCQAPFSVLPPTSFPRARGPPRHAPPLSAPPPLARFPNIAISVCLSVCCVYPYTRFLFVTMCKSFLATSLFHFVHYWTLEHGHWKIFYFTVNLSICSFIFLFLSSLRVYTSMCFVYVCGLFWPVCSCFRRRGLPIRGFTEIADPRIFQLPSYCIAASSHYREYLIRTKACFFLEFYSYIVSFRNFGIV